MKKDNLPLIKVTKIKEHKDGSATYEFSYNSKLLFLITKELKLKKRPTKKQIKDFILKMIENTIKDKKKNESKF